MSSKTPVTKTIGKQTAKTTGGAPPTSGNRTFDLGKAVEQIKKQAGGHLDPRDQLQLYHILYTNQADTVCTDAINKAGVIVVCPPRDGVTTWKTSVASESIHAFPNHQNPYYNGPSLTPDKHIGQTDDSKDARGYIEPAVNAPHAVKIVELAMRLFGKPSNIPNFTTATAYVERIYAYQANDTRCILVDFHAGAGAYVVTNEPSDENVADFILVWAAPDTRNLKFCVNLFAYRNIVRRTVCLGPGMAPSYAYVFLGTLAGAKAALDDLSIPYEVQDAPSTSELS